MANLYFMDERGFTFGGKHSSEFGIFRTSSNNRNQKSIIPSVKDYTVDRPGADGIYYFGASYQKREFTISYAFKGLTKQQLAALKNWLNSNKELRELILDEEPHKLWMAKIVQSAQAYYVGFEENGKLYYNGEGSVIFGCPYPFARSRFEYMEQAFQLFDIGIGLAQFIRCNEHYFSWLLKCDEPEHHKGTFIRTTDLTKDLFLRWMNQLGFPYNAQYGQYQYSQFLLRNIGDLPMDYKLYFKLPNDTQYPLNIELALLCNGEKIEDKRLVLSIRSRQKMESIYGRGRDEYISIDTSSRMIEGLDKDLLPTGRIYNSAIVEGDFFTIPLGEQALYVSREPEKGAIEYHYLFV